MKKSNFFKEFVKLVFLTFIYIIKTPSFGWRNSIDEASCNKCMAHRTKICRYINKPYKLHTCYENNLVFHLIVAHANECCTQACFWFTVVSLYRNFNIPNHILFLVKFRFPLRYKSKSKLAFATTPWVQILMRWQ